MINLLTATSEQLSAIRVALEVPPTDSLNNYLPVPASCAGVSGGTINLNAGSCSQDLPGGGGHGGSIDLSGGAGSEHTGGAGGCIDLRGGYAGSDRSGARGGIIEMIGSSSSSYELPGRAGIFRANGADVNGTAGTIDISGHRGSCGGSITMTGGVSADWHAGSINTTGSGYIQFGYPLTRTTLSGTATESRTVYLPNTNGTVVVAASSVSLGTLTSVTASTSALQVLNGTGTTLGYIPIYSSASLT